MKNEDITKVVSENISPMIRAFWRRIYPYRNKFDKELPDDMPIEFSAHMSTAMYALDHDRNEDGEAAFMAVIAEDENMEHRDIYLKLYRAGYRLVREPDTTIN